MARKSSRQIKGRARIEWCVSKGRLSRALWTCTIPVRHLKKILPERITREKFLRVDYAILRNMDTGDAYRMKQDDPNTYFTAKVVKVESGEEQVHLHLRWDGKDLIKGGAGIMDFDIYLTRESLDDLADLRNELRKKSAPQAPG